MKDAYMATGPRLYVARFSIARCECGTMQQQFHCPLPQGNEAASGRRSIAPHHDAVRELVARIALTHASSCVALCSTTSTTRNFDTMKH